MKREEFIFIHCQKLAWYMKPSHPFWSYYIFNGRSSQRSLEWDATEVLTFKGADELASVCVTEWEITQRSPARGNSSLCLCWIWVKQLNLKSENIGIILWGHRTVGNDHDSQTWSKMSFPEQGSQLLHWKVHYLEGDWSTQSSITLPWDADFSNQPHWVWTISSRKGLVIFFHLLFWF